MLSFNKKYLNIIVTLIFISSVEAEFIVVPRDTEAAVGDNATLHCSSSLGRCEWYHLPIGANGHEILYQGGYIYNGYKGRFSVTEKNGNACNLQIESVSNKDAGLFTCLETSKQATQTTAELIVFEKFPSDKTCAAKITCAPTCNDLELSCAMQSYGNLRPIMEWNDSNGKRLNSTLSDDKTTSTVHIKVIALQPLTYICQVKYPSRSSLSSKYMWSYSVPVYLEEKTPFVASTTEQPEQKKTVPVGAFVAAIVIAIVALVSTISIFLFYIRRNKRKSRMPGDNPATTDKKMVNDKNNRSTKGKSSHVAETAPLRTEKDALLEHGIEPLDNAASVPPFTKTRSDAIFGLAILDNEVFIVAKNKTIVEVFDLQSAIYKRQWKVNGLVDPNDMTACPKTELIFICDWKNCVEEEGVKEEEIFILDKTGMLHNRWRCEGERGRISVTKDRSLLITDGKKSVVYEYTFNGQLLSATLLKVSDLMICHAIKLESGNFVACFEDKISKYHEITMFDSNRVILNSFKNDPAYTSPRSFSTPKSLAVDSKGNIYLASAGGDEPPFGSKITSFSPRLEWKENTPNPKEEQSLSGPLRICLCESESSVRLLVADNKNADGKLVEGKIRIFNLTL